MSNNQEITEDEIIRLFNQRRQEQLQECVRELQALLEKYNCQLEATTVIRNGKINTNITVVNRPVKTG